MKNGPTELLALKRYQNMNDDNKKRNRKSVEIPDGGAGNFDVRSVKAAGEPGAAVDVAGAGRPRRPVWFRYAVAAAATLFLLVAAGLSVFIANSVIRGSHGDQAGTGAAETADPSARDPGTGDWTVEFGDAGYRGYPGPVEYSCGMTVEDQEIILGIWNRYEHPEGLWDGIPDACFRLTDDPEGGTREFFGMNYTRDPKGYLFCYHNGTDLNDPEKEHWVNTYAFISDSDAEVIFGMIDRYRAENAVWTMSVNGEGYQLTREDWESFREIWLDYTRLYKNQLVGAPREEDAAALIGGRKPTFSLTLENSRYKPEEFRFYRDLRLIEFECVQISGVERYTVRKYTYVSEEDAAALTGMMTHYGISAEAAVSEIYNAGYISPEVASGKWTGETDACDSQSLPLFIIDSSEELDGFMTRFKGAFDPDRPREEDGVTFAQGIAGYDAGFFEDSSLVLVLIEATSGGDRFRVGSVFQGWVDSPGKPDSRIPAACIYIVNTVEGNTDDLGAWMAVIPVPKTMMEYGEGRCLARIITG